MSLLSSFFEALAHNDWYRYALIAGIIIAFLAPLVGSVVVIRRLSFIADTLSHFSLAGVTAGILFAQLLDFKYIDTPLMGVIFGVGGTFLIEKLRSFYKNYKELSMPIILSFGVALSGLFINLSSGINSKSINGLLFGSLNNVELDDLIIIIFITVGILIFVSTSYKKIITLCFDETYARVSGINVKVIQTLITICIALVISFFLNLIGVLLVSSLMIIPVATGILIGKSYVNTLIISIVLSEISLLLGFIIAYFLNLPTGPTVILINIFILIIIMIIKSIRKYFKFKEPVV